MVDGCITKAPCGGQVAGPSPVDRRKQGLKRSVATEARGLPPAAVPAAANHRDDGLLAATLDAVGLLGPLPQRPTVHLDAGYDYQPCRQVLSERGMAADIATRGKPTPVRLAVAGRWSAPTRGATSTASCGWCTERRRLVVEFWLALVNAVIVCGRLIRHAWSCYRWDSRPRRP